MPRAVKLGLGAVALAALLLLGLTLHSIHSRRMQDMCDANALKLQLALETWSEAYKPEHLSTWRYPDDFEAVRAAGYMTTLPLNPYSHRPIRELQPGQANTFGDFRYIPIRQIFRLRDGATYSETASFLLVVYVPEMPQRIRQPWEDRLGDGRCMTGEPQPPRINPVMDLRDPELARKQALTKDSRLETMDEALARLGYK